VITPAGELLDKTLGTLGDEKGNFFHSEKELAHYMHCV
jgi:hypothetical protein